LESGLIVLWKGSISNIPTGFVLCDGQNNTPDLRDKFIIGAGGTYNVNDSGGDPQHTHPISADTHEHAKLPNLPYDLAGFNPTARITSSGETATTDQGGSISPYYALAFIMRL